MESLLNYFIINSGWIKDLATIVLTTTATIIAILTYRRARATVLQPKRTEIIKIQTQTLIDFLKVITVDGNNLDSSIDYINIFRFNFYLTYRRTDLLDIHKDSPLYNEINSKKTWLV